MSDSQPTDGRTRSAWIAALNDRLRTTLAGGKVMMTTGVQACGSAFIAKAVVTMKTFTAFDADNDPHTEHDFGAYEVDDHRLFFKIDYYSPDMESGSEDPADSAKTVRVLTLMLAEEY